MPHVSTINVSTLKYICKSLLLTTITFYVVKNQLIDDEVTNNMTILDNMLTFLKTSNLYIMFKWWSNRSCSRPTTVFQRVLSKQRLGDVLNQSPEIVHQPREHRWSSRWQILLARLHIWPSHLTSMVFCGTNAVE